MAEKKIKTRIQQKHDTEANWLAAGTGSNPFIPMIGELIVYDIDDKYNYERTKVGDGKTPVHELPFATVGSADALNNEIFNDYENNYAGTKAFYITGYEESGEPNADGSLPGAYYVDPGTNAVYDSGLEIGDVFTLHIFNTDQSDPTKSSLRYDNVGTITELGTNTIFVSTVKNAYGTISVKNNDTPKELWSYIRVATKPDVGTDYVEGLAHVEGRRNKALGYGSHVEGYDNIGNGAWSHVEGRSNYANYNSHAEGRNTQSLGESTHTEGGDTIAKLSYSHAEGFKSQTNAIAAHAEGEEVTVTGRAAHGEGYKTTSSGAHAHTEGELTQATTNNAHAEGYNSKATASGAHAEGANTQAKAEYSHTEGRNTVTEGQYAHAEGDETKATGLGAHSEGQKTTASAERSHAEGTNTTASGGSAHAEGRNTKALKDGSHAEGDSTTANGNYSHAEGYNTTTTGSAAHAEGSSTTASGAQSHAEGNGTTASGSYSHAEGQGTQATNNTAHAEGYNTQAKASGSHAEGGGTIAGSSYQHVEGLYNIEDTEGKYIHIAGNGSSGARSNAYTLDKQGNAVFAGDIETKGNTKIETHVSTVDRITSTNFNITVGGREVLSANTYPGTVTIANKLTIDGNEAKLDGKPLATQAYVDNRTVDASKLTGTIPTSLLPSYVDDVIEGVYVDKTTFYDANLNVIAPEAGKIYVSMTDNKTYRWGGTEYAEISASLAIGETSSTAFRGDLGKTAYDHTKATGNVHGMTLDDLSDGDTMTRNGYLTVSEGFSAKQIVATEQLAIVDGVNAIPVATEKYVDSKVPFIAEYGVTTYQEIVDAYVAGREVVVKDDCGQYFCAQLLLSEEEGGFCVFTYTAGSVATSIEVDTSDTWSEPYYTYLTTKDELDWELNQYAVQLWDTESTSSVNTYDIITDNSPTISTYVEDEYIYAHNGKDTSSGNNTRIGVKIADGSIWLKHDKISTSLGAGFNVQFKLGYLDAEVGRKYTFPRIRINSSEYEKALLVIKDKNEIIAQGEYTQTGTVANPEEPGTEYSIGYYDSFTFTAPETKQYHIWLCVNTNEYYWSTVESGFVADLSNLAKQPRFVTADHVAEYVDSKVTDINMEKGTGAGAAQQLTDDEVFTIDSDYVDSKVQDKTGAKSIKTGAFGDYSTELGGKSQAKGKRSVAEGTSTIALGNYSHSEGNKTFAEGSASHAEGLQTEARGNDSHAEGYFSISTGSHAHAEGYNTHAKGHASHTEGNGTISNGQAQHVQGAWNIEDETPHTPEGYSKYAHIIGNGTDNNNRSNAHTIDWNGAGWFASDVRIGGTNYDDADKLATEDYVNDVAATKVDRATLLYDAKLFAAEDIEALDFRWNWSETPPTIEVLDGYKHFTIDGAYGWAKVGIFNGVLRGAFAAGGNAGSTYLQAVVGSINAKAGQSYKFPKTLCNSFADNGYAYLEILDKDNKRVASSPKVITKKDTHSEYDPSYLYDEFYYDSFVFTPTEDGIYKIAIYAYSYGYYGNNIDGYEINLYDLSDYVLPFATEEYVDDLAATKVTKPSADTMTNNINYLFGTNDQGATIKPYRVGVGIAEWTIPQRGTGSTLSVGTPTANEHAATKKYVDDAIASVGSTSPVVQIITWGEND